MLDWRSLPVRLAATLAAGLPPDSRCMMHLAILAALTDPDTGGTGNVQSFDSPEDFEAALAAMKGG